MSEEEGGLASEAERLLLRDAASALQASLRLRAQRRADKAAQQAGLLQTASLDRRAAYLRGFERTKSDADDMVGRFFSGHHFQDHTKHDYMDLQREARLYEEAAALLAEDPVMLGDYRRMRASAVSLPAPSPEEVADQQRQGEYIEMMSDRAALYEASRLWSHEVARLNDSINANDEEIAAISAAVDGEKSLHDFDWQVENQRRAHELKAANVADKQKLLMAITRLRSVTRDINDKYPDSTTEIRLDESSLTADADSDEAGVYAWMLGRLTESNSGELAIGTIVFGQFTRDVAPPARGYVFVGKTVDRNMLDSSLQSELSSSRAADAAPSQEEKSVSVNTVATEEELRVARRDDLQVTPFTRLNLSLGAVQGGQRTELLAYRVSGCSVEGVDGEYLESGKCGRVFKYKNVRGWALFRFCLSEIPSLGIFADSCYEALQGPSMGSILDQRAAAAFRDLVDESKGIEAGTVQFKQLFAEMSRAGGRIINVDQTDQLFYNEQLLAAARSRSDQAMLAMLSAMYDSSRAGADASPSPRAQDMGSGEPEPHGEPGPGGSDGASSAAASLEAKIPVKTQVTLSHRINYQTASIAYPLTSDPGFLRREAELSARVTGFVEEREELLLALRVEAERAQRAYLEGEGAAAQSPGALRAFFARMDAVREATVSVSECLGAWARVVAAERRRQRRLSQDQRADGDKAYSVVIAAKGVTLYPQSKAMTGGSVKAYRRGLEPLKAATELQLVGSFSSRADAVAAFERAYCALPSEKRLCNDLDDSARKQMIVCTRPCRVHFLVRTQHVPADLPCEECAAKKFSRPYAAVPPLFDEPLPGWLWKGENYLEKMWADTRFLSENLLLKKALPEFSFEFNPLLLPSGYYKEVLSSLFLVPTDSLAFLRGRIEQVAAAKRSSVRTKKTLTGYEMTGVGFADTSGPLDLDNKLEELCRSLSEVTFAAREGAAPTLRRSRSHGQLDLFGPSLDSVLSFGDPLPLGRIDGADAQPSLSGHDRARRALSILGQAAALSRDAVPATSESVAFNRLALQRFRPRAGAAAHSHSRDDASLPPADRREDEDDDGAASARTEQQPAEQAGPPDRYTKSVYTEAVYVHRGAKFATGQLRAPLAFREPQVWCRSDKGEFRGISMGRAARSHEFQEQLRAGGAERNRKRKQCQDGLRREISRHFVSSNVPRINKLIERAALLKGSVLALDVIQAETYKESREAAVRRIRMAQARFRGVSARRRVAAMVVALRSAEARRLAAFNAAIAAALALVPAVLQQCLRRCVQDHTRPLLRMGANLSGHYVVVSLIDGVRGLKKPLELCRVCNRSVAGPEPCWAAQGVPCMCRLLRSTEQWTLSIFDPLRGSSLTRRVDVAGVRAAMLKGRAAVAALMDPQRRMQRLVGESFQPLQPLFSQKDASWDFVMEKSYTMARLKASLEGSALPLLPREISPAVTRVMDSDTFCDASLAAFALATTCGLAAVTAVQDLQKSSDAAWDWQPLADMRAAQKHSRALQQRADVLDQLLSAAAAAVGSHSEEYSEESLAAGLDRCLMAVEDHRGQLLVFLEQLEAADSLITRVMRFSKGGLSEYSAQERGVGEDRVQSYDDFQDGNAWRGLNNKRKMQLRQGAVVEAYTSRLSGVHDAHCRVLQGRQALAGSERWLRQLRASFDTIQPRLDFLQRARGSSKAAAREALRYYVSTLSLPQKRKHGGTRLQQVPYELVFVRDPLERARKRWRGAWQLLDRRVLTLRPVAVNSGNEHFVLRCVVEILTDATTGYFVINVGQDEMPMEESVQHTDFCLDKTDFSDLTSHGMDNDILMRPGDVQKLLSKPHNWPATHIERRVKVFKHCSLWLAGKREDAASAQSAATAEAVVAAQLSPTKEPAKRATVAEPPRAKARSPAAKARRTEAGLRSPASRPAAGPSPVAAPAVPLLPLQAEAADEPAAPPREAEAAEAPAAEAGRAVEYVPPSRRARSLAAYASFKNKATGVQTAAAETFASRASGRKQALLDTAARLFSYLRLQPHTGRPCLGLTHFMRRVAYSSRHIAQSAWLQDVLAQTPALPAQIYRRLLMVCGRVAVVSASVTMRAVSMDVLAEGRHVAGTFALKDVLRAMQAQPLLLAAFLTEIVSHRFSPDSMAFIAGGVDLRLPGQEEQGQEWRRSLPAEVPAARFVGGGPLRYRGPVACKFKFIGGAYFKVAISVGAADELLLHFSSPRDGNFSAHVYRGEPFSLELSQAEVRAIAARAAATPGLLPARYLGSLDLLHAHHREALLDLLVDSVRLEPSGSEDFPNQIGLLLSRVTRTILQYNSWCRDLRCPPPAISGAAMAAVAANLQSMQSFDWRMELNPGDQRSKLVRVYSRVWRSLDLEKFVGGDDSVDAALMRSRAMRSEDGAHSKLFPVGARMRAADSFGHEYSSFWRVNVLADQQKQHFFLDLSPTTDDNKDVEAYLADLELAAMAAEDASALQVAQTGRRMRCLEQLQDKEEEERALLQLQLIPQLRWAQRQQQQLEATLSSRRQQLLLAVDEWFALRRRQLYAAVSALLPTAAGEHLLLPGLVQLEAAAEDSSPPPALLQLQAAPAGALGAALAACLAGASAPRPVCIACPWRQRTAPADQRAAPTNTFGRTTADCGAQTTDPFRDPSVWSLPRARSSSPRHAAAASVHAGALITSSPRPLLLDALSFTAYSSRRRRCARLTLFDAQLPSLPFLHTPAAAADPTLQLLTARRVVWSALLRGYVAAVDRAALLSAALGVQQAEERVQATTEASRAVASDIRSLVEGEDGAASLVARTARVEPWPSGAAAPARVPPSHAALLSAPLEPWLQLPFPALHFLPEGAAGPLATGLFVPADEAAPPVPVLTFAALWPLVAARFLGEAPLRRVLLHSCIVVLPAHSESGGDKSNPRLERWHSERQPPLRGASYWESMVLGVRGERREAESFQGDALLLLREAGEGALAAAAAWMKQRFDEYAPVRLLRLQKEGREREYRVRNHQLFRDAVFRVATIFCDDLERMFTHKQQQQQQHLPAGAAQPPVSPYLCRVLVTRYLELRRQTERALPGLPVEELARVEGVLDEAFAVDRGPALAASTEQLLRYDALPPQEQLLDVEGMLRYRYRGPARAQVRPDLRPRVGQVLYAAHLVHCLRCIAPPCVCRFPGCARVREAARPQLELMGEERAAALLHSGEHPLELAIKVYLLSGRDYHKSTLQAACRDPQTGSPEEEEEQERVVDAEDLARKLELENLCLHWRAVLQDNRLYRHLHRTAVRSSLGGIVAAADLRGARGAARGDAIVAEAAGERRQLQAAAAALNSPNLLRPMRDRVDDAQSMAVVRIPRLLAQHMLGGRHGRDCRGNEVPFAHIDPYPASAAAIKEGEERAAPMHPRMFDWIAAHLTLARPQRQPRPASGDRGQLSSSAMGLKLDRLHCERSNILQDGSRVVVIVLHGVLHGASMSSDAVSGVPAGAVRHCPMHLLEQLRPGLTVVVYDLLSDVTVLVGVQASAVKHIAEAFDCREDDYPRIAEELLRTSRSVLRLSRIGSTCTGASLDLNCIREPESVARAAAACSPEVLRLGRRRSMLDPRAARLAAAHAAALAWRGAQA